MEWDGIAGVLFDLDQTLLDRDASLDRFLSWQWRNEPLFQGIPEQCRIFIDRELSRGSCGGYHE